MDNTYTPPSVIKTVGITLETGILAASVITKDTKIETSGQKTEENDFSQSGFNTTWE